MKIKLSILFFGFMKLLDGIYKLIARITFYFFLVLYKFKLLSFMTGSCLLAMIPGQFAVFARRLWYEATLTQVGCNLNVQWMAVFIKSNVVVGNDVYIGPFCWVASVCIGNKVTLAAHVSVLSGKEQHKFDRLDIPIIEQKGLFRRIVIESDVWIGTGSIVMEDIASGTVVGAGSVVTKKYSVNSVIAGVPAKVLNKRG